MQNKRPAVDTAVDSSIHIASERDAKRARRGSVDEDATGEDFMGIRRRFASALFVSPGTLIFCPRLSNIRPFPTLLAKLITPKLPSPSQFPVVNTNLDKTHPLPLPKLMLNAPPYSYAQPTILSRSHDPRYFLAFFPRVSDETRRRLSQQAAASLQVTTMATNQAVQDIVNGADPGLATSAIPSANDMGAQGYDTEIEEYQDFGGVLVLYTRPDPSPNRITYSHTFDIYASWRTDYCALDCKWLFPPRKWIFEDSVDGGKQNQGHGEAAADAGVTTKETLHGETNGIEHDDEMKGIFGDSESDEAVKQEDQDASAEWRPPTMKRTPAVGPLQPTYSSTNSHPSFVVLFADHRLNLYFSALPAFPATSSARSNNAVSSIGQNAQYPKVDVISCPILTPSVVLYNTAESSTVGNGNVVKPENGKPDSSAASSPEQPLLQQQQQQILQQQQQTNELPEGESIAANRRSSAATTRAMPRKVRQIRPGQATIHMREEDETIWVGFRSYRPTRVYVPVDLAATDSSALPQVLAQNGGGFPMGNGDGNPLGYGTSPAATGISSDVVNLLKSMPRERGPNQSSVEALATIGVMSGGSNGATGTNSPNQTPPIDYAAALQAVKALKEESFGVEEGEEEDWICVTELRLDLVSGVPSVSARPIPQINFPYPAGSDESFRLKLLGFAFVDNKVALSSSQAEAKDGMDDLYSKEGRDLDLVMIFTQMHHDTSKSMRIEHYKFSRQELDVSDAFALLSPSDKGSGKSEIKDLSRLEWLTKTTETKSLPIRVGSIWRASGFPGDASAVLFMREFADQRIRKIVLSEQGLEYATTGMAIKSDHELTDVSLNPAIMVSSSLTGHLSISPINLDGGASAGQDMVYAFASAIINAVAYDDLLRAYQSTLRKLKGSSLDDILTRIWKILQEHDGRISTQETEGDWLVPYLEFAATVFRITMDDRLHTTTLLLHLIAAENLFMQSRIDSVEKQENARPQRMRAYDTESAWLLLAHMEWYFQLVRTIVLRSLLSTEDSGSTFVSAQNSALDFLLTHPLALKLLLAICTEIRGFALFVTRNTLPSAPYPGSSQTALLLDAVSTSQLQNILRDRVENLGIRFSHWERVLRQLSQIEDENSTDAETEVILSRLTPNKLSRAGEALPTIASNTDIVVSELELFTSAYRMPDFYTGRDILSKEPFVGTDVPGQQYCQCSFCHGIGSLWNYPSVRGYGGESAAARWMARWSARCICGGSWV